MKVGRYILCDRILRTQLTTLPLPERTEFTTQQMLSNKICFSGYVDKILKGEFAIFKIKLSFLTDSLLKAQVKIIQKAVL